MMASTHFQWRQVRPHIWIHMCAYGIAFLLLGIFPHAVHANSSHGNHADSAKAAEHMAAMDLVSYDDVTHRSVRSGDWSNPKTWGGTVPKKGARVLIRKNHIVTVDKKIAKPMMTVRVNGILRFAHDTHTRLVVDTIVVSPKGTLRIGTPKKPIQKNVSAKLIIKDGNGGIETEDASSPDYDPYQLGQGLISHGTLTMHGAAKTSYATTKGALIGDKRIVLDKAPIGWRAGDTIAIAGTTRDAKGDELRTIKRVNGESIVLDAALEKDHTVPRHTKEDLELRVHVANLSHNAVIQTAKKNRGAKLGTDASYTSAYQNRGHVMIMHNNNVDIRYAEFRQLGRSNKAMNADDTEANEHGHITHVGTNQRARYPLHFHRAGSDSKPARVHGSSVVGSPGWGYVNHGSNVVMTNNVAYNIRGAAFVSERGDEQGAFIANLSIRTHNWRNFKGRNLRFGRGIEDFGFVGSGFWLHGMHVVTRNNIASGASQAGFAVWPRGIDGIGKRAVPDAMLHFENNQTYGSRVGFDAGLSNGDSVYDRNVGFVSWANTKWLSTDYKSRWTMVDPVLIGDIDDPYGVAINLGGTGGGKFHRHYINPHVEGFLIGWESKSTEKAGLQGGYFNNVVNILHDNGGHRRGQHRGTPEQVVYSGIEFGKMPKKGLKLGVQQVNTLDAFTNQWTANGKKKKSIDSQIDYLFLMEQPPTDRTVLSEVLDDHRQWVKLNGKTYEMFYKKEQSRTYVPFSTGIVEGTGSTESIDSAWMNKTNAELSSAGIGSVGGQMLPKNWKSDDAYIDAGTKAFKKKSGVRFDNVVLKKVSAGSAKAVKSLQVKNDRVAYSTASKKRRAVYIDVLDNDTAQWNTISLEAVTEPQHGTASIHKRSKTVAYTPEAGFEGIDSFQYVVRDGFKRMATGTVYVHVGTKKVPNKKNKIPVAKTDSFEVMPGEKIALHVLQNDTDEHAQKLLIYDAEDPAVGKIDVKKRKIWYRAPKYFEGKDQFTYRIIDAKGLVSVEGTVHVTVAK